MLGLLKRALSPIQGVCVVMCQHGARSNQSERESRSRRVSTSSTKKKKKYFFSFKNVSESFTGHESDK